MKQTMRYQLYTCIYNKVSVIQLRNLRVYCDWWEMYTIRQTVGSNHKLIRRNTLFQTWNLTSGHPKCTSGSLTQYTNSLHTFVNETYIYKLLCMKKFRVSASSYLKKHYSRHNFLRFYWNILSIVKMESYIFE